MSYLSCNGNEKIIFPSGLHTRSSSFNPQLLNQTNYVSLGQEWDEFPSDFLDGSIAEFIIFDHALVETEQKQIERKLSRKYLAEANR